MTVLLGDTGQVYSTLRAAQQYAASARNVYAERVTLQIEEARRELTELAAEAKRVEGVEGDTEQWRLRKRSLGVDLSLRVSREKSRHSARVLLVIVGLSARPY